MDAITLTPFERPFQATVTPPGSKSLTNRALVLAALADGPSLLSNVLVADDTEVMLDGLARLGFALDIDREAKTVRVEGLGGRIPAKRADVFCGNSGTTIRFLAALCCLGRGTYRLDGNARMRERPIAELVDLLASLGARIDYEGERGFPPLIVNADGLAGGKATFPAGRSSQYLSAALMAAPYAARDVVVELGPGQTSWPYVEMTMRLMAEFGVPLRLEPGEAGEPAALRVLRAVYTARDYAVEPDASSATYLMAAAAIRPAARVTIPDLGRASLQGDVGFGEVLAAMGAEVSLGEDSVTVRGTERFEGVDVDMSGMPDAAMTLAAASVFARGETVIRGLHTLRVKETERLGALQAELTKLGADARVEGDTLRIAPPDEVRPATIETYDDHRMAMSFGVVGTRAEGVTIRGPDCVSKTYPGFWTDLEALRGA